MKTAHNMNASSYRRHAVQSGFTLIEIMVGLVIGMLATLVIMQVFAVFEVQKRATTGAADAVSNGSIALFRIGREMQDAGFSLIALSPAYSPLKCATPMHIDPVLVASGVTGIAPVVITDGPGNTSDTILLRYGTTQMGGVPTPIASGGNPLSIRSTLGCKDKDISLVVNGPACSLSIVTAVDPSIPGTPVTPGKVTLHDPTDVVKDATLACLENWREVTYRVNANTLERQDIAMSATFDPMVADIVSIQAQYGVSLIPNSNQVVQWVDAIGAWDPLAISTYNRTLIKSVRIAVVARDEKMEPNVVTTACNTVTNTGLCAWVASASSPAPTIDLSADGNWQHYRYRVYDMIIPLRNVVWSGNNLVP